MTMQAAPRVFICFVLPALLGFASVASATDATFLRGVNLNGPTLQIDGRTWDAGNSTGVVVEGKTFENQNVALQPATDPARARMIRSSIWGSKVGVTLSVLENHEHRAFLYVWEDTASEQFDLLVNDKPVIEKFHSGAAGSCFSSWLAGAGVRGGLSYGSTDDIGAAVTENRVHVHDFHATILHLLGMDHERLTFRHGGRDYHLTDVHGHVVQALLA